MAATASDFFRGKSIKNYWLYFLPSSYFIKSRLNNLQALLYHGYNEWIAGIFILIFFRHLSVSVAVLDFFTGYIAFLTLYETGYLVNDFWVVKSEESPRERGAGLAIAGKTDLYLLIAARVIFFVLIVLFTELSTLNYVVFSVIMLFVFGLHNFISEKEIKFVTFISLSLFRFILPVFPFLKPDDLKIIVPSVFLNYSLYRTINYLDSKDLLSLTHKKEGWFKLSFYILLLPLSFVLAVIYENAFPFYLTVFFLVFWLLFYIKEKAA